MRLFITSIFILSFNFAFSQERKNPIVTPFGGIYDIPEASVKADPSLNYKIVIDLVTGNKDPSEFNWSLNNVARLLNLHAVAGADVSKMDVVLAIHGGATMAIASDRVYRKKYGVDNPNNELIKALSDAGVRLTVCGQSLISRDINAEEVNKNVEIAISMLTTVTTHQLNGYALLKF